MGIEGVGEEVGDRRGGEEVGIEGVGRRWG